MEKQQYIKIQTKIVELGSVVRAMGPDLDDFIRDINRAEAIAPIIDPTLYRKGMNNLDAIKKLAQTLLPVREAFEELRATAIETLAKGDMDLGN